jgi:valyl-tRNA synthetase
LEALLKLLHPFMPFITEEIWHLIRERDEKECIIVAAWPQEDDGDNQVLYAFEEASEVVTQIRNLRKQKNLSPKESLALLVKGADSIDFEAVIHKLGNLKEMNFVAEKPAGNVASFIVKQNEYFIPLQSAVNSEEEKERLEKELSYNRGFLESVVKKLSNERFVQNAKPELVEVERKKQADAEAKIKALEEQLASL